MQAEHSQPVVAAMLLEELDRAELHDFDTLPDVVVTIGSEVDFLDEATPPPDTGSPSCLPPRTSRSGRLDPDADRRGLYGLSAGQTIEWPD